MFHVAHFMFNILYTHDDDDDDDHTRFVVCGFVGWQRCRASQKWKFIIHNHAFSLCAADIGTMIRTFNFSLGRCEHYAKRDIFSGGVSYPSMLAFVRYDHRSLPHPTHCPLLSEACSLSLSSMRRKALQIDDDTASATHHFSDAMQFFVIELQA